MNTQIVERVTGTLRRAGVDLRVLESHPRTAEVRVRGVQRRYQLLIRPDLTSRSAASLPIHSDLPLILTRHLSMNVADTLRSLAVDSADEAGNMRLDLGEVLIDIKADAASRSRAPPARVFRPRFAPQVSGWSSHCSLGRIWPMLRTAPSAPEPGPRSARRPM
ncbi:hypothetical protein NKG05_11270 [Oerskovia sp. M15]